MAGITPDQLLTQMQLNQNPRMQGSNVATPPAPAAQQTTANSQLNNFLAKNPMPSQANFNPYQINLSALGQVQPTTYGGAQVGPAATYGGAQIGPAALLDPNQIQSITRGNTPDLSANATIQQLLQGFQPEQTRQENQLNQQLASLGLSGGPAIAAQNNLSTQQTQAIAPAIAQAIQNSQANQLNAGQFGSNALIQALTGNAGAINNQNQNEAQFQQQAGLANAGAINSRNQLQSQFQQQAGLANADAMNTANTTNVGARNSAYAANVAAQQAAQQAYLQQLQQQWIDQFSAFNSINDAGLGATNNIAVNAAQNFGTPSTSDAFSGLGAALGGLYAPTARTAPAVPA